MLWNVVAAGNLFCATFLVCIVNPTETRKSCWIVVQVMLWNIVVTDNLFVPHFSFPLLTRLKRESPVGLLFTSCFGTSLLPTVRFFRFTISVVYPTETRRTCLQEHQPTNASPQLSVATQRVFTDRLLAPNPRLKPCKP